MSRQGAFDLAELFENELQVFLGDTDAGIAYREAYRFVRIAPCGNANRSLLGKLKRVRYEIAQNLRHLALIGAKCQRIVRHVEQELDGRIGVQGTQHAAQGTEQLVNPECRIVD